MFASVALLVAMPTVSIFAISSSYHFGWFRQQIRHWTRQGCQQIKYAVCQV